MGYQTNFRGSLQIIPEITYSDAQIINNIKTLEERLKEEESKVCFEVSNESEKFNIKIEIVET